jgi:hypothetical protein
VSTVSPEDTTHFDDVLAYRRLADFVRRANLSARDWPESGATYADVTVNTATVSTSLGTPASYGDLGQATLNFQNATVTAFNAGGNENISFQNTSGTEGIGGMAGTPGISSDSSEGVRIDFAVKAQHFGVTLNHFGKQTGGGPPREERVEFRFIDSATAVQVLSVTLNGCRPDGGLASFSIDVPANFDRVEIRALPTTGATTTEFFLAQFKTCAAAPCTTALSVGPPNNTCP